MSKPTRAIHPLDNYLLPYEIEWFNSLAELALDMDREISVAL